MHQLRRWQRATMGVGGATYIHHAPSSRYHPGFLFTLSLSRRRGDGMRVGIRSSRRIVRDVEPLLLRLSSTARGEVGLACGIDKNSKRLHPAGLVRGLADGMWTCGSLS